MKRLTGLLLAAGAALLSACGGQPIEPTYYLLRPAQEIESRELSPSKNFALGRIVIAPYMDQAGMLLETRVGEIRPARHHLWAEPMYEAVHAFLVKEISRAKGEDILPADLVADAIVVEVRVDQLHGTADGEARLVAYWWLRRGDDVLAAYQFAESQALVEDGYGALAKAEQALLTRLAQSIATSMVVPG